MSPPHYSVFHFVTNVEDNIQKGPNLGKIPVMPENFFKRELDFPCVRDYGIERERTNKHHSAFFYEISTAHVASLA